MGNIKAKHYCYLSIGIALLLIFYFTSQAQSPRSKFENQMEKNFKTLIKDLKDFSNGETTRKMKVTASYVDSAGILRSSENVPDADADMAIQIILPGAKNIVKHFKSVSLAFLKQDTKGFDEWGDSLKGKHAKYMEKILKTLKTIKMKFQEDPSTYTSFMFGKSLGIDRTDKLYFIDGRSGYYIDEMVNVDIDEWLVLIKEHMKKY